MIKVALAFDLITATCIIYCSNNKSKKKTVKQKLSEKRVVYLLCNSAFNCFSFGLFFLSEKDKITFIKTSDKNK